VVFSGSERISLREGVDGGVDQSLALIVVDELECPAWSMGR